MTPHPNPSLDDLAGGEIDSLDLDTLRRMRAMYDALDPVPTGLVDRISFGITLDALHAELAELQRTDELVGVRGDETTAAQTITFTSARLTTMITITVLSPDSVRLDGWVAPDGAGVVVELRLDEQRLRASCDDDGRFVFAEVPRGLAQFVLRSPAADEPPVLTPSVEL
jgi:hypothetical protein